MCREKGFGFVFLMTIPYLLERLFHPAGELGQLSGNEFFKKDFTSLKKNIFHPNLQHKITIGGDYDSVISLMGQVM